MEVAKLEVSGIRKARKENTKLEVTMVVNPYLTGKITARFTPQDEVTKGEASVVFDGSRALDQQDGNAIITIGLDCNPCSPSCRTTWYGHVYIAKVMPFSRLLLLISYSSVHRLCELQVVSVGLAATKQSGEMPVLFEEWTRQGRCARAATVAIVVAVVCERYSRPRRTWVSPSKCLAMGLGAGTSNIPAVKL